MGKCILAKSGALTSIETEKILRDYRIAITSRQASLTGRKEVFTGKAKFGIFGDGKEVAQLAMAHAFRKGDIRSGYYRDQTLMFALGMCSVEEFFAQLYAHPEIEADPSSAGRSMNAHFATRSLNPDGSWKTIAETYNSSADVSPTGSQMPRLVGLAYASRLYRELDGLRSMTQFSSNGDEIAFGTIGNASCAEGLFWEAINAVGVLKAPALISIWDDEYGISVHNEHQITKGDLTEVLSGFQRKSGQREGFDIHTVRGWDYPALCETYRKAAETVRREHVPAIVHVIEMTQPQGHSTSGSHERYKNEKRLKWEEDHDCIKKMREWIIERKIATAKQLDKLEQEATKLVAELRAKAWEAFESPVIADRKELIAILERASAESSQSAGLQKIRDELERSRNPLRRELMRAAHDALMEMNADPPEAREALLAWHREQQALNEERYSTHLYSESDSSAIKIEPVPAIYDDDAPLIRGFEVLTACFDAAMARYPELIAFGEDVGKLGGVNQGFSGLQEKYGELRVSDTGIREATIVGQGIGLAMRGLRPIVEIQYLDYVLYALQIISDDLASLRYRTRGGQMAPLIIRSRGHRLEGIWHSGSPMAGIIHLVRGVHVCVPRDMTTAAGFYNTLLRGDDPGLIVEVLNGYRLKEKLPRNIGEFCVPLGRPEVIRGGDDVTLVTYGACCRIAEDAAEALARHRIEVEIIDVQTLLPFDVDSRIVESLRKTSRIVFLDEDVPGGATAYMMQQVLDRDGGYALLDSAPRTISAKPHRPAYGSDGDYWSKPHREQVFRVIYELMREADPGSYPDFL